MAFLHVTGDRDAAHEALHAQDVLATENRRALDARGAGREIEDGVELVTVRERNVELEEEAIELRLGQRIRAFHLERVLRREYDERLL